MIETYSKHVDIKWSDLDPNFHLRHSVYYDFGAYMRMCFLTDYGLPPSLLVQHNLGPILFREECLFKKEIRFGDDIVINLSLTKASETFSRWSIQHKLLKGGEILAAIINVDGAWMDTGKRKLTVPSAIVSNTFNQMPRSEDFEWIKK